MLPFSRAHESEADWIGLQLMAQAGFDPSESVKLWENMKAAGGGGVPEFLSTHPSHETRIDQLQRAMPEAYALYERAKTSGKTPVCRLE
jgi:predicted Zn-dependent protease